MERLRYLFRQSEFHVLLFCLFGALWSWPFVSFSDLARLRTMFLYLVITWALVALLLFLVGWSLRGPPKKTQPFDEIKE